MPCACARAVRFPNARGIVRCAEHATPRCVQHIRNPRAPEWMAAKWLCQRASPSARAHVSGRISSPRRRTLRPRAIQARIHSPTSPPPAHARVPSQTRGQAASGVGGPLDSQSALSSRTRGATTAEALGRGASPAHPPSFHAPVEDERARALDQAAADRIARLDPPVVVIVQFLNRSGLPFFARPPVCDGTLLSRSIDGMPLGVYTLDEQHNHARDVARVTPPMGLIASTGYLRTRPAASMAPTDASSRR